MFGSDFQDIKIVINGISLLARVTGKWKVRERVAYQHCNISTSWHHVLFSPPTTTVLLTVYLLYPYNQRSLLQRIFKPDRTLSCLALRLRSLAAEICRTLFPLLSSCFCVEASTLLLAYPNVSHYLHLYRSIIYANHITQSIGTVQVKHWYMVSNIIYCCYSLTYRYISFIRFLQPIEPLYNLFMPSMCLSIQFFQSLIFL